MVAKVPNRKPPAIDRSSETSPSNSELRQCLSMPPHPTFGKHHRMGLTGVLKRTGRTAEDVLGELADVIERWTAEVLTPS